MSKIDVSTLRCIECGEQAEHKHHVIPKAAGGIATVPMCEECHKEAHAGMRQIVKAQCRIHHDRLPMDVHETEEYLGLYRVLAAMHSMPLTAFDYFMDPTYDHR